MPSRRSLAALCAGAVLLGAPLLVRAAEAGPPGDAAIEHALGELRADPNLGGKKTIRSLRWVDSKEEANAQKSPLLEWFVRAFNAIAAYARLIAWILGGAIVAAAAIWAVRFFSRLQPSAAAEAIPELPTHVSNLDIRPEALPDDIGGAAERMWQGGEHRAALSLLYRGALSRLVNRHAVRIRSASTEGECLQAAAAGAAQPVLGYFRDLVAVWLRATYAGELPADKSIASLCRDFAAAMDGPRS